MRMLARFPRPRGRLETPEGLRRGVGSPALFGIVQGFVAAAIYFGLGVIAQRAQGYTWLVLLAACVFFVLLVLSYVEGASLHQERGGATVIARYAFNELWSFIAGWAICLDYVILVSVTAFVATNYAAVLWSPLGDGTPELLMASALVVGVAALNIRGPGPRLFDRLGLLALADLALSILVIAFGFALVLDPDALTHPATLGAKPSFEDVAFAFTLAIVAFTGLDASSGLAGQVAIGRAGLKRLITVRVLATVIPYVGIGLVAVSALPLDRLRPNGPIVQAPVVGVVDAYDTSWVSEPLRYLVALSAFAMLFVACNAAMLGLSRLGYSLALNRQIPSLVGRLHPTRHTPVVIITIGSVLAIALLIPADLDFLSGLYAFGATIAFTLVHVGVLRLRVREPDRDRPFRIPVNVRIGGTAFPISAALGALVSLGSMLAVIAFHSGARIVGLLWMAFGIALYTIYRLSEDKPLLRRITVPEETLTRADAPEAQYGSILVPIFGHPLDDDIMQTAGRLASEDNPDPDDIEEGVTIEAIWVHRIPMSLPLDARVPESDIERAKAALRRAKAVGEEYDGVRVETHRLRARAIGEAIVAEAARKGVEAIVLAAEEPTRMRGGMLLGGKEGLHDTYVGETTRYVISKAPCRVILTAPPGDGPGPIRHPRAAETVSLPR